MWTCPKCREEVADGLDDCWNCGVDKNGSPISDTDRDIQSAMGRQAIYIDNRQGLLFCIMGGLLGSIFFFFYHPTPPYVVKEIIEKIKLASAANSGIKEIVFTLTKSPNCYIISGLILFGSIGLIIDRLIGNGNSLLCKISHQISCSDIDKPIAKQIIAKGMSRKWVEERLGNPLQIVNKDTKQLWVYKFIKITFENGKVSGID